VNLIYYKPTVAKMQDGELILHMHPVVLVSLKRRANHSLSI